MFDLFISISELGGNLLFTSLSKDKRFSCFISISSFLTKAKKMIEEYYQIVLTPILHYYS